MSTTDNKTTPGTLQVVTKPLRPLTRKQAAFVKHLIDNPKASATAAARQTYNLKEEGSTARTVAAQNLAKPSIQLELAKHSQQAESVVLEVMGYSKDLGKQGNSAGASYATTALQAANSLLDRVHGKATQRIEQHTTSVTIGIDLTEQTSE